MKITDTHVHIFPSKIASAAVNATGHFYSDTPMAHDGTVDTLLNAGARAGVSRFVVFSTATTPHQVESINSFIIRECAAHPEFTGVGTMHADYPREKMAEELDRIKAQGIYGIKLHPDIQQFNVDDDRLLPLYELMEEKHMFLITHSGDYRYDYSHPRRLARLAGIYPKMRFIAAHFGGWSQWKEAREYLNLKNVYFDTSSTFGFGGFEPAIEGFKTFDNSHIFFASDYPMWDPKDEIEKLLSLGLDDRTLEMVFSENFDDFYATL